MRNLILIMILAIVLLCAIGGEGYFYFYSQRQNSSADSIIQSIQKALKPESPLDALAQAKIVLADQTEKLDQMEASFPNSSSLDSAIRADVARAAAIAARDDALVADQKLGLEEQANIVALGQRAASALAYLQSLADSDLPISTVALNDAAENAIELTAAYSKEISSYLDSLSPTNSNISAGEISGYQSQADDIAEQANSTEDSLNQIDETPASSVTDGSNDSQTNSNGQTPTANDQIGDGDNQAGIGGSLTLGDINDQENVVEQDTNEVDQLVDQTPSGDASSSDPSSNNPSGSSIGGNNGTSGNDGNSGGIQDQSGPVKLIEGENTF